MQKKQIQAMDIWAENSEPHFEHLSRFKMDILAIFTPFSRFTGKLYQ